MVHGRSAAILSLVGAAALTGWTMLGADAQALEAGGATFARSGSPAGLVVTSLRSGGAAALAGLHVGDVIDDVDGHAAPDARTLRRAEDDDVALLHVAARGDAGPRTLLWRRAGGGHREDPDRRR